MFKQFLTPEQAFVKAKQYCSYQERSHAEVKEKLYKMGLTKTTVELTISKLIEEDYLNEERFVQQFAGGKFRMKHWGKIKIRYELKQKNISDYLIKKALLVIDEDIYLQTIDKLLHKKWSSLKHEQYLQRTFKTTQYLLQKGFELNLIQDALKKIKIKL